MDTSLLPYGTVPARANWGRWIVDCPACTSALQVRPGMAEFVCWDCGWEAPVRWPPDPAAIERILLARPDPNTRNWEPGETLHDLLMENAAHGLLDGAPEGLLLATVDDRATTLRLPQPDRRMIGG